MPSSRWRSSIERIISACVNTKLWIFCFHKIIDDIGEGYAWGYNGQGGIWSQILKLQRLDQYFTILKNFGSIYPTDVYIYICDDIICVLDHLLEAYLLILQFAGIENWKSRQKGHQYFSNMIYLLNKFPTPFLKIKIFFKLFLVEHRIIKKIKKFCCIFLSACHIIQII